MRRILITVVATTAVLAATPAVAAAHHRRHHRTHHATRHHRRRVHHRWFRADQPNPSNSEGTAGMVTSFENGVLTITLNDNSTVSGAVTDETEIECTAPNDENNQGEDGDNQGDTGDNSGDDNTSANQGDDGNPSANTSDDDGGGQDQGDDDQGEDEQMCSTSALTPGTPVSEAELKISSSGKTWDKVDLVTS